LLLYSNDESAKKNNQNPFSVVIAVANNCSLLYLVAE